MKKLWICRDITMNTLTVYNEEPSVDDIKVEDRDAFFSPDCDKYVVDDDNSSDILEAMLDTLGVEVKRGQFIGITFDSDVWELETDHICPECGYIRE